VTVGKSMPRWPLFLIAAPAAVAVWSGWVGLGGMCGFGPVHLLPGIADGFVINTAITLPVGVEAYGAYALGAWLAPGGVPPTARKFARRSAVGALALGMAGQVIYHLLAAAHATRAPWPVVVLVSCMPVVTLGFGAALTHLLRAPGPGPASAGVTAPEPPPATAPALNGRVHPAAAPAPVLAGAPGAHPAGAPGLNGHADPDRTRPRTRSATDADAVQHYASELAEGRTPSQRRIRSDLHVGQDRARQIWEHLEAVTRT
jgi:hypothetical protein